MKFHYFTLHYKVDRNTIVDLGSARTAKKLKVLCKKLGAKVEESPGFNQVGYFFIQEHMFEYNDSFDKENVKKFLSSPSIETKADKLSNLDKKSSSKNPYCHAEGIDSHASGSKVVGYINSNDNLSVKINGKPIDEFVAEAVEKSKTDEKMINWTGSFSVNEIKDLFADDDFDECEDTPLDRFADPDHKNKWKWEYEVLNVIGKTTEDVKSKALLVNNTYTHENTWIPCSDVIWNDPPKIIKSENHKHIVLKN